MQIRGRHRGLLCGVDRAISRASASLHRNGHKDATGRARCSSNEAGLRVDNFTQMNSGLSYMTDKTLAPANIGTVSKAKQMQKALGELSWRTQLC